MFVFVCLAAGAQRAANTNNILRSLSVRCRCHTDTLNQHIYDLSRQKDPNLHVYNLCCLQMTCVCMGLCCDDIRLYTKRIQISKNEI